MVRRPVTSAQTRATLEALSLVISEEGRHDVQLLVQQVRRVFRGTSHHRYIWSIYKRIRRRFHPYSDTSLSAAAMYLARSMTHNAQDGDGILGARIVITHIWMQSELDGDRVRDLMTEGLSLKDSEDVLLLVDSILGENCKTVSPRKDVRVVPALKSLLAIMPASNKSRKIVEGLLDQAVKEHPTQIVLFRLIDQNRTDHFIQRGVGLCGAIFYLARSMTSQAQEMDVENGLGMVSLARARFLMASVL